MFKYSVLGFLPALFFSVSANALSCFQPSDTVSSDCYDKTKAAEDCKALGYEKVTTTDDNCHYLLCPFNTDYKVCVKDNQANSDDNVCPTGKITKEECKDKGGIGLVNTIETINGVTCVKCQTCDAGYEMVRDPSNQTCLDTVYRSYDGYHPHQCCENDEDNSGTADTCETKFGSGYVEYIPTNGYYLPESVTSFTKEGSNTPTLCYKPCTDKITIKYKNSANCKVGNWLGTVNSGTYCIDSTIKYSAIPGNCMKIEKIGIVFDVAGNNVYTIRTMGNMAFSTGTSTWTREQWESTTSCPKTYLSLRDEAKSSYSIIAGSDWKAEDGTLCNTPFVGTDGCIANATGDKEHIILSSELTTVANNLSVINTSLENYGFEKINTGTSKTSYDDCTNPIWTDFDTGQNVGLFFMGNTLSTNTYVNNGLPLVANSVISSNGNVPNQTGCILLVKQAAAQCLLVKKN